MKNVVMARNSLHLIIIIVYILIIIKYFALFRTVNTQIHQAGGMKISNKKYFFVLKKGSFIFKDKFTQKRMTQENI